MDGVTAIEFVFYGLVVLAFLARLGFAFMGRDLHRRTKRPPRQVLPMVCARPPGVVKLLGWRIAAGAAVLLAPGLSAVNAFWARHLASAAIFLGLLCALGVALLVAALRAHLACRAWHHLGAALELGNPSSTQRYGVDHYCLRGLFGGIELKVWSERGDLRQSSLQVWGVVRIRTRNRSWPDGVRLAVLANEAGGRPAELPGRTGDPAFDACFSCQGDDARAVLTPQVRQAMLALESHAEVESFERGTLRSWLAGQGSDPTRVYGAVRAQLEAHRELAVAAAALRTPRF